MPSYGGAHGPDGSKKSGDQGQGSRDKSGGTTDRAGGRSGGGMKSSGKIDLKDLNPQTPGFGALGPRGPLGGWGSSPDFKGAMAEYNDRSFFDKAIDFLGGSFYDAVKPNPLDPRTYAGGTYHSGTNVPGALGSLFGGALAPGAGMLLGGALGMAFPDANVLHGGDPSLTGYNTGTSAMGGPGPLGGGNGNGNLGAMPPAPKPGQITPATPAGASPPPPMTAGAYQLPSWLSVPGPSPYTLQQPGYNYWRGA